MGNRKIRWVIGTAWKSGWRSFAVKCSLMLFLSLLGLAGNLLMRDMVNALEQSVRVGTLKPLFLLLLSGYFLVYFIHYSGNSFLTVLGTNYFQFHIDQIFQNHFMKKSDQTEQAEFLKEKYLERYTYIMDGISNISQYLGKVCDEVFSNIVSIGIVIGLYLCYEPLLILILMINFGGCLWLNAWLARKKYALSKKQVPERRFVDYYYSLLTEKPVARELRMNHLKSFFYEKWSAHYLSLYEENLALKKEQQRLFSRYRLLKCLLFCLSVLVLFVGLYQKHYNIGVFVMLFTMLDGIQEQVAEFAADLASGIFKDCHYLEDYYDFVVSDAGTEDALSGDRRSEKFLSLEARNLSYTYPKGDKKALDQVSFSVKRGEYICILGVNGSGKTTLSRLINGSLQPDSGEILLNGKKLDESSRILLRKWIGNAPQEYSRFSLKVRELVGIGCLEKKDEEAAIQMAIERANAKELVEGLEHRENTILGKEYESDGRELSGGEWQRLIIAQAYMGEPPVLLMDEPTASVDPLQEQQFMRLVLENKKKEGQAVILISHRVGFAKTADRVVVMSNGKIQEEGTHQELLDRGGMYANMFTEQKNLYVEEC